jgi:hypothetical protein
MAAAYLRSSVLRDQAEAIRQHQNPPVPGAVRLGAVWYKIGIHGKVFKLDYYGDWVLCPDMHPDTLVKANEI